MELIESLIKKYNRKGFKIVSLNEMEHDYIGYVSNNKETICFSIQDKKNILICRAA